MHADLLTNELLSNTIVLEVKPLSKANKRPKIDARDKILWNTLWAVVIERARAHYSTVDSYFLQIRKVEELPMHDSPDRNIPLDRVALLLSSAECPVSVTAVRRYFYGIKTTKRGPPITAEQVELFEETLREKFNSRLPATKPAAVVHAKPAVVVKPKRPADEAAVPLHTVKTLYGLCAIYNLCPVIDGERGQLAPRWRHTVEGGGVYS